MLFFLTVKAQTDCNIFPFRPVNYLRNPSFEKTALSFCFDVMTGAPISLDRQVPNWYVSQFGGGKDKTVVYYGECNEYKVYYDPDYEKKNPGKYLRHYPLIPQPIPDGKSVIGLSDFQICTILTKPLKKDSLYQLTFYTGLGSRDTLGYEYFVADPDAKISIYGLTDSTKFPIRSGTCMGGWTKLGTTTANGIGAQWTKQTILFSPPADINVLSIGSACELPDNKFDFLPTLYINYLLLDKLELSQCNVLRPSIEKTAGSLCEGSESFVTLEMMQANFYRGSQFQWYKDSVALVNETSGIINISKAQYGEGLYQCRLKNDSICTLTNSMRITWDPHVPTRIGTGADTSACIGDTIRLKITGGGPRDSYLWLENLFPTPDNYFARSGTYSVRVSNNCDTAVSYRKLTFNECKPTLFVPNAFTPNNDRLNDVFRVHHDGVIKTFSMSIYNRSGQRIFYSDDILKGWDGTIKRVTQDSGTFTWVITYTDGLDVLRTEKGTVTLLR